MNDDQVYCKTPDGERALVQRTRLVQRNLRNVLILVDGTATVADLTRKLGDGNFLRASLAELVRGGFVETVEENRVRRGLDVENAPDSEPKTIPIPSLDDKPFSLPPQLESVSSPSPQEPLPVEPEAVLPLPEPMVAVEPPVYIRPPIKQPFWRRWFATRETAGPSQQQPTSAPSREATSVESEPKPIKVRIKPIRRRPVSASRSTRWSWFAVAAVTAVAVGAIAVLALVVFPYDRHTTQIEERASAWLGQPVRIGEIRFGLIPRPGFTIERVRVGGEEGVVLGSMRGSPSLLSLFGEKWRLGTVVLERPLIDERAIKALFEAPRAARRGGIEVQRVAIEQATVAVAGLGLEGVSGAIDLTPEARISEIVLRDKDGKLRLTAVPRASSGFALALTGTGWNVPWRGGMLIDSVEAEGSLERRALRIEKLNLRTLGGTIAGSASFDWHPQIGVSVQANLARVNLQRLLALLEPAARAQGDLSGKIALRANAASFEATGRALSGGGSFSLERGSLEGFDLVEAVRSRSENPVRGGTTKLEDFAGSISLDPSGWRLSGLHGSSGVLSTSGYLRQAGGKVDGVMEVQLRGSANQVNLPVVISGSLADPMLTARRRGAPSAATETGQRADDGTGH